MIQVGVHLGADTPFVLGHALLIYRSSGGFVGPRDRQQAYVTVHEVEHPRSGPPVLAAGRPADTAFLRALATSMETAVPPEVLPEHVLCRTTDIVCWWSAGAPRPMHFRERTKLAPLTGRVIPQPALVWKLQGRALYVRALEASARPEAKTPLHIAPYWNTDHDGRVCLGDMKRPEFIDVANLRAWEEGFFGSLFTGQNNLGKRYTKANDGIVGVWRRAGRRNRFPTDTLEPAKETLQEFLGRDGDDA